MKLSLQSAYKLKHLNKLTYAEIDKIYDNFNRLPDSEKQKIADIIIDNYNKVLKMQEKFDNSIDVIKGYNNVFSERVITINNGRLGLFAGVAGFGGMVALCLTVMFGVVADDAITKFALVPLMAISCLGLMEYVGCEIDESQDVKHFTFDKHPLKIRKLTAINSKADKVNKLLNLAERVNNEKYEVLKKL